MDNTGKHRLTGLYFFILGYHHGGTKWRTVSVIAIVFDAFRADGATIKRVFE